MEPVANLTAIAGRQDLAAAVIDWLDLDARRKAMEVEA